MSGSATGNGMAKLFEKLRVGARWPYAIALLLACATVIVIAVQSYRAIDRELTESALSRT